MNRENRQKASDVFHNSEYVFVKKVPFSQAFPEIESLEIKVQETGSGAHSWGGESGVSTYTLDNLPGEYINCSNSLCYNGGFSLGSMIREAVREQKTEFEKTCLCQGYEGSPKGRRRYRSCLNHFKVHGKIKYKG